ncbi:MAG: oligosaccharide flippase family protein, partial [Gammaproteobacteria bacterium]|nr:oligosaccharide flippase family protein [Gammaproteobacteria bacterium]
MTGKRKFVFSLSNSILLRFAGIALGFVVTVLVTRTLGITESGYYLYVLQLLTFIATFLNLGLKSILLREIAGRGPDADSGHITSIVWSIFLRVIPGCLVAYLLLWSLGSEFVELIRKEQVHAVLAVLLPLILIQPFSIYLYTVLQALTRVHLAVLLEKAVLPVLLIIGIVMFSPSSALAMAQVFLGAFVLSMIVSFVACRRYIFEFSGFSMTPVRGARSFFTIHVVNNAGLIIITLFNGYFLSAEELSVLIVATRFVSLLSFALVACNFIAAPRYARLYKEKRLGELKHFAQYVCGILLIAVVPVFGVLLFFSDEFMSIFGNEFAPYGWVLAILLVGQTINVMTGSVGY